MNILAKQFGSLLLSIVLAGPALAADYDLVIINGRVMDPETMLDATMNVGIKDGRIAVISSDEIAGTETIDATGLVVAPGFIDSHYHAMDPMGSRMALKQGITTGLELELGVTNAKKWYEDMGRDGWVNNYGATSALMFYRAVVHDPEILPEWKDIPLTRPNFPQWSKLAAQDSVLGYSTVKSNIEQMNSIMQFIDEDLRAGALGLGSPSGYMATGLTSYEQFEAQRTAARYGRLTSFHTRFHGNPSTPTEATIGANEAMLNAVVLDAPMIIGHDNDYGWWEIEEKLQALRKKGYVMWGEYYPYAKSGGTPQAEYLLPENFIDKYHYKYEEQVYDPSQDKYLTQHEVAELRETDPARQLIISLPAREKWMSLWIRTPGMTVASDAVPTFGPDGKLLPAEGDPTLYRGHPRTAGSAPKVLRLGREEGVPLLFTLAQLSYWPAMYLGDAGVVQMKERGRMQEGMVADIVVFDPVAVTDNATFRLGENGLPPTGISHVIVAGKAAVRDGEMTGVKAGVPIRYPVEDEGRFVPLDKERWERQHLIGVPHLHVDDACVPEPERP